ncbi:peroxiredoxin-5, mitochondrial [Aplysia californica]|uniref:Peroxiredoxin-5 n=1 Tax=Aplysia californica TaxID=6500 RepID=A0ABM0JWC5_APLCA|nr:peroxiredoxin-5, mitochondrial [Aplysia californica]
MQAVRSFIRPVASVVGRRCIQTSSVANMPVKASDKLPSVDLFEGAPDAKVNTGDFGKGKVVIFGVPGAFTPTCSKDHAPGFVSSADALKAKGVKDIVCVSVNDPFVMAAWAKSVDPDNKIRFLADTNGALTKALDVELDLTAVLGNVRCKRYALVAEDGVVKAVNIEPDGAGLSCSRAADILKMV